MKSRSEIQVFAKIADEQSTFPLALSSLEVEPRTKLSSYPEPFRTRMAGREKRSLGDRFGLKNFGVNLTRLLPGSVSSLMHSHSTQDEFVYILSGEPTLHTNKGSMRLRPGMCAGFPLKGLAHHLVNETSSDVLYLEVGDRSSGDAAEYPQDDLAAVLLIDGSWQFTRKNGDPY